MSQYIALAEYLIVVLGAPSVWNMGTNNGSLMNAISSVQPQHSTSPISTDEGSTLRAHRGIGNIVFDLDGTLSTDMGWVIFEVNNRQSEVQGVIGTFNNYDTLTLVRFERTQKPCRIHGRFDDGATEINTWLLDDVVFTGLPGARCKHAYRLSR